MAALEPPRLLFPRRLRRNFRFNLSALAGYCVELSCKIRGFLMQVKRCPKNRLIFFLPAAENPGKSGSNLLIAFVKQAATLAEEIFTFFFGGYCIMA
ncbi:hypothetical protein [Hymenobacter yonginensis]|uniref:Transposase DDE domain-containing protein n=1 Tax=Hymenobacter yonginensis TaxID=748197 RepID=A0ABY7PLE9_9BACT|nr:hypothetical protein [Hymenobacter yonginensis]WBO83529.1 hypothetical protein O9Z63_14210 [Hymenobacter yonginensis]